jgi:hypothetical protein
MPFPASRMFTCRHCGVQIRALIPLRRHPHRVFTALLIPHLSQHPELSKLVLAPPLNTDAILPRLLQHVFDGPPGFDASKTEE